MTNRKLNFRDLGGIPFADGSGHMPHGLFLRSGKLSVLTHEACARFCAKHHIGCVIDLRTAVECSEFPDPLPEHVEYVQVPLLKDATVGVTHETGSDPMTVIRRLRKHPEQLIAMIPDVKGLYVASVTDEYCMTQLCEVLRRLKENAEKRVTTLFHCTAGKDRTGVVSMALLKSYGVGDEEIIRDYLRSNRNTFWPTVKKCMGIGLLTGSWKLMKTAYHTFLVNRELIEAAINHYALPKE